MICSDIDEDYKSYDSLVEKKVKMMIVRRKDVRNSNFQTSDK